MDTWTANANRKANSLPFFFLRRKTIIFNWRNCLHHMPSVTQKNGVYNEYSSESNLCNRYIIWFSLSSTRSLLHILYLLSICLFVSLYFQLNLFHKTIVMVSQFTILVLQLRKWKDTVCNVDAPKKKKCGSHVIIAEVCMDNTPFSTRASYIIHQSPHSWVQPYNDHNKYMGQKVIALHSLFDERVN